MGLPYPVASFPTPPAERMCWMNGLTKLKIAMIKRTATIG